MCQTGTRTIFITLLIVFCLTFVGSSRILGVFPMPSLSHHFVFRALTMELARRGHELVVITPTPALPKDRPPDNITEIDVSSSNVAHKKLIEETRKYLKRGVIIEGETWYSDEMNVGFTNILTQQLDHPDVKRIIEDKNQHFDLIIVEASFNTPLIFSEIFKAPAIELSSYYGYPESYEALGAIGRHPIYYPSILRSKFGSLSIREKLWEVYLEYFVMNKFVKWHAYENKLLKEKFGSHSPTVEELRKNIDFVLINVNPIFRDNRPVPPNVAFVGPLHLRPAKELPQHLQSYLDNSATGVIYVSLGNNILTSQMDEDLLDAFLEAFEVLPFDFLWKFDGGHLKRKPKNVKIQKWFPQRDLLVHHNIKLFVCQGGLQSSEESIDASVPMVAIPMLGDQYYNVHKMEQLGIAVRLDALTLDAATLVGGIKQVLSNDSYRRNIERVRLLTKDQTQTPMERAIWWIEYVIRHGGARHLRCPTADVTWAEYLMLDVVIVLLTIFLIVLMLLVLTMKYLVNVVKRFMRKRKVKLP